MGLHDGIGRFLAAARARGWNVRARDIERRLEIPIAMVRRFGAVPESFRPFLSGVAEAADPQGQVWFWCEDDLQHDDPARFCWNSIETMALEHAETDEERRATVAFWERHFPIMLAVHSDYDYLAIALDGPESGSIVHGYAPFWEEPTRIASSFDDWLTRLSEALEGDLRRADLAVKLFSGSPDALREYGRHLVGLRSRSQPGVNAFTARYERVRVCPGTSLTI